MNIHVYEISISLTSSYFQRGKEQQEDGKCTALSFREKQSNLYIKEKNELIGMTLY